MTPFIPIICPIHNCRLEQYLGSNTAVCSQEKSCVHFKYNKDWEFEMMTYFHGVSMLGALVSVEQKDDKFLLMYGDPPNRFSFTLPEFDPLDFTEINKAIKLGLIFK